MKDNSDYDSLLLESLKNLPVGKLLPPPYCDFSDEKGNITWDVLDMVHPGKMKELLERMMQATKQTCYAILNEDYRTSITLKGYLPNTSQLPPTASLGDGYIISSEMYVFQGSYYGWVSLGGLGGFGPQGVKGPVGLPGISIRVTGP